MQRRNPAGLPSQWRVPEPLRAHATIAMMVATGAVPLMLLTSLLSRPLVLPVICLTVMACAAAASLLAWLSDVSDDPQRVTTWDVAGALVFIGFAAGMLSNPEHVIHLADNATTLKVRE
jgi:4-hydroxybenzoate polyprenyltransferase